MANATDTTTLPATWAALQAALGRRRPVHVRYHGRQRLICPHALGWRNQRALVLGYQVGGQTSTGALDPDPCKRWRCMFVDEIELVTADHSAQVADARQLQPRPAVQRRRRDHHRHRQHSHQHKIRLGGVARKFTAKGSPDLRNVG